MDLLTDREAAVAVWTLILAVCFSFSKGVRKAFVGVLRSVFNRHIIRFLVILVIYVSLLVLALWWLGLWKFDQLKTTLFWVSFSAIAAGARAATRESLPHLFGEWVKDTFKLTVLIELLAMSFTFPLWAEIILVPLIVLFSAMIAFAGRDPAYSQAKGVLEFVLALLVMAMLVNGIYMIATNWNLYATANTFREIYTPPLLGLLMIPFAYVVYLYLQYEQSWTRARLSIHGKRQRDYAIGMAIVTFGPRTELLRRWTRDMAANKPNSRADILNSMRAVLKYHQREKTRPEVDSKIGWCPVSAGLFLMEFDLKTNDYHELDGEWFASSQMKELNDGLPPDNLAYYVEGTEQAATRLKLKLNINSETDPQGSETAFLSTLQQLIERGASYQAMFLELRNARQALEDLDFGDARLTWTVTQFPTSGYSLKAELTK